MYRLHYNFPRTFRYMEGAQNWFQKHSVLAGRSLFPRGPFQEEKDEKLSSSPSPPEV